MMCEMYLNQAVKEEDLPVREIKENASETADWPAHEFQKPWLSVTGISKYNT